MSWCSPMLRKRVSKRGGMTKKMIDERLELGEKEIEESKIYDHKIVNFEGKLEETTQKIAEIIKKALNER